MLRGNALRTFPGIPLGSTAGIPHTLYFKALEASRALPEFSLPPSTVWDASLFRSGSGENLSELLSWSSPAVLGACLILKIQRPTQNPEIPKKTACSHELLREVRVKFCLLPCGTSQEPNGNSSEKFVQMNFSFFGGWIYSGGHSSSVRSDQGKTLLR